MNPLEFLREQLKNLTWAQMIELGKRIEVSPYTMNNIVNQRHSPRYEIVESLVRVFGYDVVVQPAVVLMGMTVAEPTLEDMEGMAQ